MEMIREQSGDVTAGAVHALVRVSLWLSGGPFELMVRTVLRPQPPHPRHTRPSSATSHPCPAQVRGMSAMEHDYGRTFTFEQPQSPPGEHRTHVTRCFFHDVFTSEGVPHLAQCCCCSVDKLW
jgi:hypothetical protein